jgi:hypothetical protein
VMEQASKRSPSHEGGLLLDPLHKGTRFPLLPKDREDRQRRVPALHRSSVSGFPPPVVRRLASPEPEILHRLLLLLRPLSCYFNNSCRKWST